MYRPIFRFLTRFKNSFGFDPTPILIPIPSLSLPTIVFSSIKMVFLSCSFRFSLSVHMEPTTSVRLAYLDVERQVAYELVPAYSAKGVFCVVNQQAAADVVVDVALLDDQISISRYYAESWIDPFAFDVDSYELARGTFFKNYCRQRSIVLSLNEIERQNGVLGKVRATDISIRPLFT